jgi:hypothetical protein
MDHYKAFQYTAKDSSIRIVVEFKEFFTVKDLIRKLNSLFSGLELAKYENWQPIEEDDRIYVMEMPQGCLYCPTSTDTCDDDCNCDRCMDDADAKAQAYYEEQENFDIFGGDPMDERTWVGSPPDVQRWGDQI